MQENDELINKLALKSISLSNKRPQEIERYCWMVVHQYHHGSFPLEYDVREIDEALYVSVLEKSRNLMK